MYRLILKSILLLVCFASLLPATLLATTESDPTNWYQVEVLIFKNLEASAIAEEQWPHRTQNQYPSWAARLQTDNQFIAIEEGATGFDVTAHSVSRWRPQAISEPLQPLLQHFEKIHTLEVLNLTPISQVGQEQTTDANKLTIPVAYSTLPDDLREFDDYAQRMRWSQNYRVLFHQSWRQLIRDRTSNDAIVIESNDRIGDYPELQGTIQLSVSRYLHLQTNLWLNMPELPWTEEEPRSTPPPPPKPYDRHWQFTLPVTSAAPDDTLTTLMLVNSEMQHSAEAEQQARSVLDKRLREQLEVITTSRYPYAGSVLMEQNRRMRSGEEHYIDHPLFGLLIKITPYEFTAFFEQDLKPETESTELSEILPATP